MTSTHTPIAPRPTGFVDPSPRGLRRIEHVMGMPVVFEVCDQWFGSAAVQRTVDWLHWVDRTFSTYRRESEISRLNHGELTRSALHPEVRAVLARCDGLRRATAGYFDISAPYAPDGGGPDAGRGGPGSVDPSGFVKGWAVARTVEQLGAAGARNFAVNAGGDLIARGHPDGDDAWRIGIQHPRCAREIALTLAVRDRAVATSGTYVRGPHIVNPHTAAAPAGLLSVTITGPELPTADAYATAAFAMGAERAAEWCAALDGYDAVLMCDDDTVLSTPGIDRLRL
jgi:thiamine biosynthesis lipoprotein